MSDYPNEIGVAKFNDGTYDVYPESADIAPSVKYVLAEYMEAELTKLREERKAMCWALTSIRSMSQPGAVLNPAKTIETIRNIANDAVEALAKHKKGNL